MKRYGPGPWWNSDAFRERNSPIHFFIEQGAEVLLLGVGHNRNSAIHIAERIFDAPYINIPYNDDFARPVKVLRNGKIENFVIRECPGCSEGFGVVDTRLRQKGAARIKKVGNADAQLAKGRGIIDCAVEMLKEDVFALLCSNPGCPFCPKARQCK